MDPIDKNLQRRGVLSEVNRDMLSVYISKTWVSCGSPESTTLDDPITKPFCYQKTLYGGF